MASTGTAPLYRRHDNAFAGALTFLVGRRPHGVEGFARHAVSGHNQYVGFVGDLELISSTLTAVAQRIKEPLSPDQFVERRALTRYEIAAFESTLDRATKEADMQLFLEANPQILMQQLDVGVGHGLYQSSASGRSMRQTSLSRMRRLAVWYGTRLNLSGHKRGSLSRTVMRPPL